MRLRQQRRAAGATKPGARELHLERQALAFVQCRRTRVRRAAGRAIRAAGFARSVRGRSRGSCPSGLPQEIALRGSAWSGARPRARRRRRGGCSRRAARPRNRSPASCIMRSAFSARCAASRERARRRDKRLAATVLPRTLRDQLRQPLPARRAKMRSMSAAAHARLVTVHQRVVARSPVCAASKRASSRASRTHFAEICRRNRASRWPGAGCARHARIARRPACWPRPASPAAHSRHASRAASRAGWHARRR